MFRVIPPGTAERIHARVPEMPLAMCLEDWSGGWSLYLKDFFQGSVELQEDGTFKLTIRDTIGTLDYVVGCKTENEAASVAVNYMTAKLHDVSNEMLRKAKMTLNPRFYERMSW